MITAVDANVLLDILIRDPVFEQPSLQRVHQASADGALVICEAVYAELSGHFPEHAALEAFLQTTGIRLVHSVAGTLWRAGVLWKQHCLEHRRAEASRRIVADFLIGAHALLQADRLLTRDRGFYRTGFKRLPLGKSLAP